MATQSPSVRLVTEETLAQELANRDADLPALVASNVADELSSPAAQASVLEVMREHSANMADPLGPWEAALAQRNMSGPARVVFLGSSTMFGSNATNPSRRFTALLLERIQNAYPSAQPGYEKALVNVGNGYPTLDNRLGVHGYVSAAGGQTSANYLNGVNKPLVVWTKPNLVFHGVGANDALDAPGWHVPPEDFQTNVANGVDYIDANVPHPVSHVFLHQHRRNEVSAETWAVYLERLRRVAETRPNVMVLDASPAFELLRWTAGDPLGLNADLSHLTDKGHAYLADLVAKALRVPTSPTNPKVVLRDTYARPDGAPGAVEVPYGRAYQAIGTAAAAISNQALTLTAAGTVLVDSGLSNLEVEGNITIPASSSLPGLIFRGQDDQNRMGVFLNRSASAIQLYKTQAGATSTMKVVSKVIPAGTHNVMVRADGDKVWGYLNGELVIEDTLDASEMTSFSTLTKVGIRDNAVTPGVSWTSLEVRRL